MARTRPPDIPPNDGRTSTAAREVSTQLYFIARELEILNDTLEAMSRD